MKILAIDPGTKTGWAFMGAGIVESGVQDFALKRGESVGMRYILFRSWFIKMLMNMKPELVIYEQAHHRGGSATELLHGMTTRIQEICEDMKIEYTAIHSATLKKYAIGKGNAPKEAMLEEARDRWGVAVLDDNEADALFMAEWGTKEFKGGKK